MNQKMGLPQKLNLLVLYLELPSLLSCEKQIYLAYGILLQQPEQTKTSRETFNQTAQSDISPL
jgi:hypothetical protein